MDLHHNRALDFLWLGFLLYVSPTAEMPQRPRWAAEHDEKKEVWLSCFCSFFRQGDEGEMFLGEGGKPLWLESGSDEELSAEVLTDQSTDVTIINWWFTLPMVNRFAVSPSFRCSRDHFLFQWKIPFPGHVVFLSKPDFVWRFYGLQTSCSCPCWEC